MSAAIAAAISDRVHRPDDTEFVVASRQWSECVSFGNFDLYQRRFERTSCEWDGDTDLVLRVYGCASLMPPPSLAYFAERFEEANKLGSRMIKAIQEAQAANTEAADGR